MPEGDSLYQLSQRLQFMRDRTVTACSIRWPSYATVDFTGLTCDRVWPYGKHLFMQFGTNVLHTHLKMEGTWAIHRAGTRWRKPGHTARVVLQLDDDNSRDIELVGHSLGLVEVFPLREYAERMGYLGPDILESEWDKEEALRRIESQPEMEIGRALLDQKNVAGIGNEYRAEVCFIAGVHPAEKVCDVDVDKLLMIARKLMWANRESPVRVTTGIKRAGETSYVFGRNNKPCRRCGTLIVKDMLGGEGDLERVIWWCPKCQPGPVR
ncbi:DNA-formamidopyrimidine glycosylase family protein [Corynebacterium breve]|uniref:DNA-(apurinic or apyrimidinic site) lyase n=1 Tax=Corynebacterium breve TaxID=3049799 RepID=A0ABY8VJG6_9CORY|nr:DNA-formamidopyrimidine glycosylase family protein [Corynebacterium breve]WIM68373.1 DNA-formamidopyrimidine glycosylase family protein [Corynebacterium breve]